MDTYNDEAKFMTYNVLENVYLETDIPSIDVRIAAPTAFAESTLTDPSAITPDDRLRTLLVLFENGFLSVE
jgi:hypothetical protein